MTYFPPNHIIPAMAFQPATVEIPAGVIEVLEWGRSQGCDRVDLSGVIAAEPLRKTLREMYLNRLSNGLQIVGDFRRGYELSIGNERIGVTGGYGRFRVYYHKVGGNEAQYSHP